MLRYVWRLSVDTLMSFCLWQLLLDVAVMVVMILALVCVAWPSF